MDVLVAVFAFLLGAVSVLAAEVAALNELLAPVEGLADDLQTLLAPLLPGM